MAKEDGLFITLSEVTTIIPDCGSQDGPTSIHEVNWQVTGCSKKLFDSLGKDQWSN